jgi:hypothetical protein
MLLLLCERYARMGGLNTRPEASGGIESSTKTTHRLASEAKRSTQPKVLAGGNVPSADFGLGNVQQRNYTASKIGLNFCPPVPNHDATRILCWYVRAGLHLLFQVRCFGQKVEEKSTKGQNNLLRSYDSLRVKISQYYLHGQPSHSFFSC